MNKSDSETLIKVNSVSKKFCRDFKKSLWYGLKEMGNDIFHPFHEHKKPNLRPSEFWANKDISFELKKGECLGLIGRNGAGKTTLLKMLNGIIKPDQGTIEMRGKVGALIALGSGFDPILTGRENIYINGSILGLSKREINAKLDEIIEFAEMHDAIDSPVRTYSSGMNVRLGFSIATTLSPDILILDEVLAVGDAAFRNKCYSRIGKMRDSAATIFVSHTMGQIAQICDSVLLLNNGSCEHHGEVDIGIHKYNTHNSNNHEDGSSFLNTEYPITSAEICLSKENIFYNEYLCIELSIVSEERIKNAHLRIIFYDENQTPFAEWSSIHHQHKINFKEGSNKIELEIGPLNFKTGNYPIGFNIYNESRKQMILWSFKQKNIKIKSFASHGHTIFLNSTPKINYQM